MRSPITTNIAERVARYLSLAILGIALHGCATMSQEECENADWYLLGYEDGTKGRSASHIGERRGACADYRVKPNMEAYLQGRTQGLRQFCRPQNGYHMGVRGSHYRGICPGDLEEEFVAAYLAGKDVYYVESSYRSTQRQLKNKHSALDKLKQELTQKELDLVKDDTVMVRRIQLLADIHELSLKQGALQTEISQLKAERAEQHRRLDRLKQRSVYR